MNQTTPDDSLKLDIPLSQAAHLAWLAQATAKEKFSRPTLEHIKVSADGTYAQATDGFRLHAIWQVNGILYQFAGRLVRFGKRLLRKQKQSAEYSLAEETVKFPSFKDSETARLVNQKPLAVFSLNPGFVRQALQDTTAPVLIKVYTNGQNSSLVEFFADEDGVQRYALVMGMTVRQSLIDRLSWRPEELNP